MAKADIIISGQGVTATFNSVPIADIVSVSFSLAGERDEIDLTTIDANTVMQGLLGDLVSIEDVVITKKAAPSVDIAISSANAELAIVYKLGNATSKTTTYWAQLRGITEASVERAPSDGVNWDLTFGITNLNATLVETGPATV